MYSTSDPATRYLSVEAPQRDTCLHVLGVGSWDSNRGRIVTAEDYSQYVAFDNLEAMFARRHGLYCGYLEIEAHGLKVTNCHIGCIGVRGGSSAYGVAAWHSDMLIQNNIFHDCGRRAVSLNTYTKETPGLTVRNNIIFGTLDYAGGANDARCVLSTDGTTFSTRDHNLYFQADPEQPFSGSDPSGGEGWDNFMSDWDEWKAKTGWEAHGSKPQNPLFVDIARKNFRLRPGSPAIGAGVPVPVLNFDIEGRPYDRASPSIGAYEYAPAMIPAMYYLLLNQ
ncbi:MAG: hypothetical protein EOM25_10730 [Deltaproteobacteria bacterium]|nr:hypothetical protein [Deltaproteobacteria bacterium]